MRLSMPYYAQSSEFSCGPACILMVMKHLDPGIRLSRALEFEVWRQCNMIGIRGADPYGLCVPLLDAGCEVCLTSRRRSAVAPSAWRRHLAKSGFDPEEVRLVRFGMQENRRRALARRLTVKHMPPTVAGIEARMREGFVPIALVHMGVVHHLDIPHWVVVTEVAEGYVVFNDPYRPHGRKGIRLNHGTFQKILDDVEARIGMSPAVVFARANRGQAAGLHPCHET
jgi:hypothetical protein